MKNYFYNLADYILTLTKSNEIFLANLSGENSDFIRINNCKIRQAGNVSQYFLSIDLICGKRRASHFINITGNEKNDKSVIYEIIKTLRNRFDHLPEDPYLLYSKEINSSEQIGQDNLPDSGAIITEILNSANGKDLVGIYASGSIIAGFANSYGQRNWFEKYNFNFDWSLYYKTDKAVKSSYAGLVWDTEKFQQKMNNCLLELDMVSKHPKTIEPGKYRVYLTPSALNEFTNMLSWGGFGLKSHKTKNTPLIKMIEDNVQFDQSISMFENTGDGISKNFQCAGFIKPHKVCLINKGKYHSNLISPRSAKEYDMQNNGANDSEAPESLDFSSGNISQNEILETLNTGVYINNAWYLNYSDRTTCRVTGMTRFASFWVENGKITAPLNVMRFDESLYKMLGKNLIGTTKDREYIISSGTYYHRSTESTHLPGAIIKDFSFTL